MADTDKYREAVLQKIAGNKEFIKAGKVTYTIDGNNYHIKVKTDDLKKYPFNINNAVLSADFEVYVCGSDELYYVIPNELIKLMHTDPDAMPDHSHPGLTIIDVFPQENKIIYGTGGKAINIECFKNIVL